MEQLVLSKKPEKNALISVANRYPEILHITTDTASHVAPKH